MTNSQRELRLREASDAYYNRGESQMSDADFDALKAEHAAARAAAPDDPMWEATILDQVGTQAPATFEKVRRDVPMLSLTNVFATDSGCEALLEWRRGVPAGASVVVEPKLDGLSLELYYRQGVLTLALTRGDGTVGSDVTANVRNMPSVPKRLLNLYNQTDDSDGERYNREDLVVRGEVVISHKEFADINVDGRFANPRNAAAGAIMSKDPNDATDRKLRFILHSFVKGTGAWAACVSHSEFLLRANNAGFSTVRCYSLTDGDSSYTKAKSDTTAFCEFPIDGMVAKVNEFDVRRALGDTSTAPRWAVAVKFPQEQKTTTLKHITIQVGRSGVLTPVAELEPVTIDGSTVSRASLHNETFVNSIGLCVGDTVVVQKAAAIIPEVVRSVTHDENPTRVRHSFSVVNHVGGVCPACHSRDLEFVTTDKCTKWFCRNKACVSAIASHVQYWASRQCFDIEGIGGEVAEAWARAYLDGVVVSRSAWASGLEASFCLLEADVDDLASLTWRTATGGAMTFGQSRATKAVAALKRAVDKPLRVWIAGAGIPSVGINTSKELSRLFRSARDLVDDCGKPDGILRRVAENGSKELILRDFGVEISHHLGPVSARAVLEFVAKHWALWTSFMPLLPSGSLDAFSDNFHGDAVKVEGPLSGKSVCVTGTLSVGRSEFHKLLESAGAKIASGVSSKTDILVAGEAAGSKLEKARKNGVVVMTEEEARKLIGT